MFAGSGGGLLGLKRAGFKSTAAIDVDPVACADLTYLTGERATCADVRELQPADLRAIAGDRRPDLLFTSPPCVGFSGCLPERKAKEARYTDLNDLAVRGVWLALEAWDEPPALIAFENVPRIASKRGAHLLDQVVQLLHRFGYAVDHRTHDCGEIGGLAQHRLRYLLVARHQEQVPCFLTRPPLRRVRAVGEVLGELPVPQPADGDKTMHRLPKLSALNWLRLALIPAGKDWRSLPAEVRLADRSQRLNGGFGVNNWSAPAHAVIAEGSVRNTWASVADPRLDCAPRSGAYGVLDASAPSPTVIGHHVHDRAPASIADPRIGYDPRRGSMGVIGFDGPSPTIRGHHEARQAPGSVADPRLSWKCGAYKDRPGSFGVLDWSEPSPTIRGKQTIHNTQASVADPRWPTPTHRLAVVDGAVWLFGPPLDLDDPTPVYLVIEALDGTWHRPLTTLELAALQSLPPYLHRAMLSLRGSSATQRKHIGNMVPPDAAEAMGREFYETIVAARDGRWRLSSGGIWVEEARAA